MEHILMKGILDSMDAVKVAENNRKSRIIDLIEELQGKSKQGCVAFNEYTTLPLFRDDDTGYESVVAVKVVRENGKPTLYATTHIYIVDDSWFDVDLYGTIDYTTLVDALNGYIEKGRYEKPAKKALLVTANVTTRVIVDYDGDTITDKEYNEALALAKERLLHNLSHDYTDCVEDVREDEDCPYTEGE